MSLHNSLCVYKISPLWTKKANLHNNEIVVLVYLYIRNYLLTEYLILSDIASSTFFRVDWYLILYSLMLPVIQMPIHKQKIVQNGKSMFRVISEKRGTCVPTPSQNSFLFVCLFLFFKNQMVCQTWYHKRLIPILWRQRQLDIYRFKSSLVYIQSSRATKAT